MTNSRLGSRVFLLWPGGRFMTYLQQKLCISFCGYQKNRWFLLCELPPSPVFWKSSIYFKIREWAVFRVLYWIQSSLEGLVRALQRGYTQRKKTTTPLVFSILNKWGSCAHLDLWGKSQVLLKQLS